MIDQEKALTITRMLDAPREMVWKMWTQPEQLMRWSTPKGFTAPHCTMDFRVGGKHLLCMRSPEGQDFWSTGVYLEIVEHERLVMSDSFADEHGNVVPASYYGMNADYPLELRVTVTFEEVEGKTRMTLIHVGIPAGETRELTEVSWNQSFDKLAETVR